MRVPVVLRSTGSGTWRVAVECCSLCRRGLFEPAAAEIKREWLDPDRRSRTEPPMPFNSIKSSYGVRVVVVDYASDLALLTTEKAAAPATRAGRRQKRRREGE